MVWYRKILDILKDYCLNCSLAGLAYVADSRYHFTERIFWLTCFIISSLGAYHLIEDSIEDLSAGSVSMVLESVPPLGSTIFPSLAVCEMGYIKQEYPRLEELVENLPNAKEDPDENSFDIEDFMYRVIFHNLYNFGSIVSYCQMYQDCDDDCIKCPSNNYTYFTEKVRATCDEMLAECTWNNKQFDCCKYFIPLHTSLGKCFLLNSIQVAQKDGKEWFDMSMNPSYGSGKLIIELARPASLSILNEEDIPHILLTRLQFPQQHPNSDLEIFLKIQNVINDEGVIDIAPELRKCYFPTEQFNSKYKYYSYSTCVTECLKRAQIKVCNCTHHNMIYDENDKSPECDYNGLVCLDSADLIFPQTTIMQPWRTNGLVCDCLPSCTEHEIIVVGKIQRSLKPPRRRAIINMLSLPSQRFRRQATKDSLDLVVSVGGILGLFLGASILSGVEFIYFFSIRLLGTVWLRRKRT